MSSHNTENERSNRTAIASIVYCFFALPKEPQVSRSSAPQFVTFRVSPNPNPNRKGKCLRGRVLTLSLSKL